MTNTTAARNRHPKTISITQNIGGFLAPAAGDGCGTAGGGIAIGCICGMVGAAGEGGG